MLQRLKLRYRILVFILGINLVMLFVIFGVYYRFSKRLIIQETQDKALEQVKTVIQTFEGFIREKGRTAWTFSQDPLVQRWLETNTARKADRRQDPVYAQIQGNLLDLMENDTTISFTFLGSERSKWYYEPTERPLPDDYDISVRPWYIDLKETGEPAFLAEADIYYGNMNISYVIPIYSKDGKFLGAGGVDMELKSFDTFLAKLDGFDTGYAILVDKEGTILYHPDKSLVYQKKISDLDNDSNDYRDIQPVADKIKMGQEGVKSVVYDNEKRIFIFSPIKELEWTLILSVADSEINAPLRALANRSLIIILLTSIFLVFAITFLTGTISKPLNHLVDMLKDIAEGQGDLTKRLSIENKDELGDLAKWFNTFIGKVHTIISKVKQNTEQVAYAASEISAISSEMAAGSIEQTSQAAEVAASVQEMTAGIMANSRNANESKRIAEQASFKAQEGMTVMQETRKGMEEIVLSSQRTGEIIDTMSGRAEQIGEIIRIIDDIAAQTNLLSLNATIEASSAGEHGKGFAVVADEVRKLAERTKEATQEIGDKISAIQNDTREVSQSMREAHAAVTRGQEFTSRTEEVFDAIVEAVRHAMTMIKQISAASEEQSTGAEEISKSVTSITAVSKQAEGGSRQLANAAEHLNKQISELRELVHQFTLDDSER